MCGQEACWIRASPARFGVRALPPILLLSCSPKKVTLRKRENPVCRGLRILYAQRPVAAGC
ncbi:MAG TPA: hypothetical protein DC058_22310 [Planctomycetaceae bacterium]|nr:hypothetical protein [Planctomycetaceae bacterium]HBC63935.1 hypothetical protein [Planctomycetaceae bacterium]